MNRRGFFGWMTAAVGWMVGVRAEKPTTITAESLLKCKAYFEDLQASKPTQELIDDCGGFVVPAEFEPFIADTKPLHPIGEHLTIEEVCRLRGVKE
jgi:hypothetical protein